MGVCGFFVRAHVRCVHLCLPVFEHVNDTVDEERGKSGANVKYPHITGDVRKRVADERAHISHRGCGS